jgi:hypothetical protein
VTLKVLKLEFWMSREMYDEDDLTRCEPIFNRDGQYFDTITKKCWFEVDGDAFLLDRNLFTFSLQMLNHKPLRQIERDAINVLINSRLATKTLKELMYFETARLEIQQNTYNAQKFKRRVLAKMKANRILRNDN